MSSYYKVHVVNCRQQRDSHYIGRPSVLSNPYIQGNKQSKYETVKVLSRDEACDAFEQYFYDKIGENDTAILKELCKIHEIGKQRGVVKLGCFCRPMFRCHGDTIKKFILDNYDLLEELSAQFKESKNIIVLPYPNRKNSYYSDIPDNLPPDMLFVFGSNLAGRHGKGAALEALRYGAEYGKSVGHVGNTYAIPTKDKNLNVLPILVIKEYIDAFKLYTLSGLYTYYVTTVGCGLAGYRHSQIAPLFKGCQNCWFSTKWFSYLQ